MSGERDFYKTTIRLDRETYKTLNNIAVNKNEPLANIIRETIKEGLINKITEENADLIAVTVRQQLEIVLKPHIERLAALSSKSGHMSATAAFLNVQALMDLVPTEKRKDVLAMYESARKKAVAYMRTNTKDWEVANS